MINRRNTLIGIGSVVAGGGAVLATGAFSTVEAERDVTINTAGDEAALLGLELDEDTNGVSDASGDEDVLAIQFDDINLDATTTFDDLVTVTNNGDENAFELTIEIENESDVGITFEHDDDGDLTENATTIETDTSENLTVVLDTEGVTEETDALDIVVTFDANAQE